MPETPLSPRTGSDEPPPLLGRWPRVYTVVLVYLALLITLFYVFSKALSV